LKLIRFLKNDQPSYGLMEGETIYAVEGSIFGEFRQAEKVATLTEVSLLAPCQPTKILAVGLNYRAHAAESGHDVPSEPLFFSKPPSSVIGPLEPIVHPVLSQQVDYEGELAVVIGRRVRNVSPEKALDFVLGYTCGNDVTARDLQRRDNQWTRAKGFDTFCPLGPCIVTDTSTGLSASLDPGHLAIRTQVNGKLRQSTSTTDMVFGVAELIAYISQVMTLEPGDVILTGTPSGVGPLQPGDVVEVEIEDIGTLRNPVVSQG
jgi:2-keto-4-pentenoate hydratase/2-oxohepta-3-ene-1,7-dioic acid hydratase in catechol pathway